MDEEDEGEEEDLDEEDLDIGTEIDPDSPPWDMYGEPDIDDIDDSNEDTALLRTKGARTAIIVTPISPVIEWESLQEAFQHFLFLYSPQVSSSHDLTRVGQHNTNSSEARMDLLTPDMSQRMRQEDIWDLVKVRSFSFPFHLQFVSFLHDNFHSISREKIQLLVLSWREDITEKRLNDMIFRQCKSH